MATRWKIIGTAGKRPKPKHLLGVYEVPQDAFLLAQDIQVLETMLWLLDRLQPRSFVATDAKDYIEGHYEAMKTLRRIAFLIGELKRICEGNLRDDYLSGERVKSRRPKQTMADVYQLLMEGMKT